MCIRDSTGTAERVEFKELSAEESKPFLRLRGVTVREEEETHYKDYRDYGELTRMMTNMLRHGEPMAMGIMVEYFVGAQTLIDCINQVGQLSFKVGLNDVLYIAATSVMKDGKPQFEVCKLQDPELVQEQGEVWMILRSRPEAGRSPTLHSTGVNKNSSRSSRGRERIQPDQRMANGTQKRGREPMGRPTGVSWYTSAGGEPKDVWEGWKIYKKF